MFQVPLVSLFPVLELVFESDKLISFLFETGIVLSWESINHVSFRTTINIAAILIGGPVAT